MDRNIYLVGFMGAGKSHVGKKLATKLYCPFVDLDTMIERAAQMSINDISAMLGYAEDSSFIRAFQRWSGISPGKYANKLRNTIIK